MKKLLFILFCLLMSFGVMAQSNLRFGAKGGLTLSGLVGQGADDVAMKAGINVSVLGEYKFSKKWAFSPEMKFTLDGCTMNYEDLSFTMNVNYIAVPLMFRWFASRKFSLHFGPELSYAVYTKLEGENVGPVINKFNFGIGYGVAYHFTENLFGELRITSGFTNVVKTGGDPYEANNSTRTTLGVGYYF